METKTNRPVQILEYKSLYTKPLNRKKKNNDFKKLIVIFFIVIILIYFIYSLFAL